MDDGPDPDFRQLRMNGCENAGILRTLAGIETS
jgi:hypothetical protein